MIVFKAKAWLDMKNRANNGEQGLTKKIKKHLNDVTSLSALLLEDDLLSTMEVSESVKNDMAKFISSLSFDIESIPQNSDISLSREEIFDILQGFLRG